MQRLKRSALGMEYCCLEMDLLRGLLWTEFISLILKDMRELRLNLFYNES